MKYLRIYHLLKWNPQNELTIWQTCVWSGQGIMVIAIPKSGVGRVTENMTGLNQCWSRINLFWYQHWQFQKYLILLHILKDVGMKWSFPWIRSFICPSVRSLLYFNIKELFTVLKMLLVHLHPTPAKNTPFHWIFQQDSVNPPALVYWLMFTLQWSF
jgi:hypothetical protein